MGVACQAQRRRCAIFDQMQVPSALAIEPILMALVPDHLHFGQVTVINDQREFLAAVEDGIDSYCRHHIEEKQVSAQDLLNMLVQIIEEDQDPHTSQPVSYAERLGFNVGKIAGLLNPDLADPYYENLTFLEALSCKCKEEYQIVCPRDRHPFDIYVVTTIEK
jgi:hypothetical protein